MIVRIYIIKKCTENTNTMKPEDSARAIIDSASLWTLCQIRNGPTVHARCWIFCTLFNFTHFRYLPKGKEYNYETKYPVIYVKYIKWLYWIYKVIIGMSWLNTVCLPISATHSVHTELRTCDIEQLLLKIDENI